MPASVSPPSISKLFLCYVYGLSACVLSSHACFLEARGGSRSPGTGDANGYELPYACWELNLGPLQELQVLFAAEAISKVLREWDIYLIYLSKK